MTIDSKNWQQQRPVGFIGPAKTGGEEYRTAYKLAQTVTGFGRPILTAYQGGVMEAACRGAFDVGGTSIAITSDQLTPCDHAYARVILADDLNFLPDDSGRASENGLPINHLLATMSDFLIAVSGSKNTANAIKLALRFGKTVIGVRGSPYPEDATNLSPQAIKNYRLMTTPDDAILYLNQWLSSKAP